MTRQIFFFIVFLLLQNTASALSGEWRSYSHSKAKIVSSVNELAPGDSAYVGLWIQMIPHWHTYWENPGDSGTAPILDWQLPANVTVSPILWPTPQRIESAGLNTFAYSGEVFILQKIEVPENFSAVSFPLNLKAEWLVCDDICVPQTDSFSLNIPVGKSAVDGEIAPLAEETLRHRPETSSPISMKWNADESQILLELTTPLTATPTDFFPALNIPVSAEKPKLEKISPTEWKLSFKKISLSSAKTGEFSGILFYEDGGKAHAQAIELKEQPLTSLWRYLLWAFLGGLILNLMPCVLPIITLKAFSLLKNSGSSLSTVRKESFLYTIGVVSSLWILSLVIYFLQNAGRLVGWGFQLQSPYFNLFLILIFILMALNLLGVFEIQLAVPARFQKLLTLNGSKGALATGFLSVVVASPCTAPFMGVAIGFALSQSLTIILMIFTSLGLGLALPYLLMGFFPQLVRYFPKPGRWMETFKKILALPMILSAVWLGIVFYNQVAPAHNQKETTSHGLVWLPFSEEKVNELRGKKAFFIDFTADWCLSCKVNERVVFSDTRVLAALKNTDLVLLQADWTNYDPTITRWLKKYQRAGVPFYILVHPDGREQLLPELLTPKIFLNSIKRLKTKENSP
jgi:thiol:disulfide interchange protein DsbD